MCGSRFPAVLRASLPHLSADQMRQIDRAMVEELGIELSQMMENAGRHLAQLAREDFLGGNAAGKRVLALAGRGGNGGGALVAARHLHNAGARVSVVTTHPPSAYGGVPAHQLAILERMHLPLAHEQPPAGAFDLVLDGLIGYSLAGPPCGTAAALIRWANRQPAPCLALDVPSGLDASTGAASEPTVRAAATLTLALPKRGLRAATDGAGELYLADIGVPHELYASALDLTVEAVFSRGAILRLQP